MKSKYVTLENTRKRAVHHVTLWNVQAPPPHSVCNDIMWIFQFWFLNCGKCEIPLERSWKTAQSRPNINLKLNLYTFRLHYFHFSPT